MSDYSKRKKLVLNVTRRNFLRSTTAVVGASVFAPAIINSKKAFGASPVVFVGYGGTTQEAQEATFIKAFKEETGIDVVTASGPDLGKLAAQVRARDVQWDVIVTTGPQAIKAGKDGLCEELDYSIIDTSDMALKSKSTTLPVYSTGAGIAYDSKRHPQGKHPESWQEFWDVGRFPGRRGLRSRSEETLEIALVADGVPANKLYPLDIDRAFRSLDRIKPHVSKWIKETPQTISLLQSSEVDFVLTFAGRVEQAQQNGMSIEYVYKNNLLTNNYLVVPKGSKNKTAAMKLVSYWIRPDLQAAFCNRMGYSPGSRKARELLNPDVRRRQPELTDPNTILLDAEWWGENLDKAEQRFKEWLLI